jgi:hypothetical protein
VSILKPLCVMERKDENWRCSNAAKFAVIKRPQRYEVCGLHLAIVVTRLLRNHQFVEVEKK